jgi:hypothetical protein
MKRTSTDQSTLNKSQKESIRDNDKALREKVEKWAFSPGLQPPKA